MQSTFEQRLLEACEQFSSVSQSEQDDFLESLHQTDPEVAKALQSKFAHKLNNSANLTTIGLQTEASPADSMISLVGNYQVEKQIGSGGMGVIYRVRDPQFERTLAVKMMLPTSAQDDKARRRFLEEAKLTGQLQHPGIPPAHELGQLDGGVPYFSMKLIEGQTLAQLLKQRQPGADAHLLGIFTQICHTVGYAHSRGVIHRDLKPENVMVGAHGEVQVMDWGLAKVVATLDDEIDEPIDPDSIQSLQLHDDRALSQTGQILGTPAYMAPEQAKGKIRSLDSKCDVFGLGSILCEILTGTPAFQGRKPAEVLLKAIEGDLRDAIIRLDECGADTELIALCKRCLSPSKDHRHSNASEVASVVETYEATLQARLRESELAQTEAKVQAIEERKRRRWTLIAAFTSVLLVIGGAIGTVWYQQVQTTRKIEHARRLDSIRDALTQVQRVRDELQTRLTKPGGVFELLNTPQAWSSQLDVMESAWQRAKDYASASAKSLPVELAEQIEDSHRQLQKEKQNHALAMKFDKLHQRKANWVQGDFNLSGSLRDYPLAFQRIGIDIVHDSKSQIVKLIQSSPIHELLIVALDDWAYMLIDSRWKTKLAEKRQLYRRLLEISRLSSPDPWGDRFRQPKVWLDPQALAQLRDEAMEQAKTRPQIFSPQTYRLMGLLLKFHDQEYLPWLRFGQLTYPEDFGLTMTLADLLREKAPLEALSFGRAALAIRPNHAVALNNLGLQLQDLGKRNEAILLYRKAIAQDHTYDSPHVNLGLACHEKGKFAEAIKAYQRGIALNPKNVNAYYNLGNTFRVQKKLDEAIAAYRQAIALNPKYSKAYFNLAMTLSAKGDADGAIQAYQRFIALGIDAHHGDTRIGAILYNQRDFEGAIRAWQSALKANPNDTFAYLNMGTTYLEQGEFSKAASTYENALRHISKQDAMRYQFSQRLLNTRSLAKLKAKLPEILRGENTNPPEQIRAAKMCLSSLKRYQDALKLYQNAFEEDPKLVSSIASIQCSLCSDSCSECCK